MRFNHKMKIAKKSNFITIAVMLLLIIGYSLFLQSCSSKQVPVYQGMSVSYATPAQIRSHAAPFHHSMLYDTLAPEFALLAHKDQGLHDNRPGQKTTAADENTLDAEAGAPLFYASPNEDFYITVHINNPDKFEIVSFTLNGEKYSSYMFEQGSDMENLILKCNVGDASGIVEYTIDAIKYIDGTTIKDVRMEGDQTVRVGVYTENQPVASLIESEIGFGEIALDVTITDPAGLLSLQEYEIRTVLYKGSNSVDSQAISLSETNAVRFTGLDDGTEYRVAVVADYDSFNGAGRLKHSIGELTVTTPQIVTVEIDSVSYTEAVYKLNWHENVTDKTVVSLALYQGDEKICDVDPTVTKLTGLLSDASYTLKAEYAQDGKTKSRSVDFQTKKVEIPTLQVINPQPDLHSLSFKLNRDDPQHLITIDKIELLLDGNVIDTAADAKLIEFTGLEVLQTYTARITYSYDLMDGKGNHTQTVSKKIPTQSKGLKINFNEYEIVGIGTCTDDALYINMPIDDLVFANSQISEVVLGSDVTYILENAFYNSSLSKITIHDGCKTIRAGAFDNCANLTDIIIPSSVTYMGYHTFAPNDYGWSDERKLGGNIYCRAPSMPNDWDSKWCYGYNIIYDFKEFKTDSQGVTYAVLNDGNMVAVDFNNSTRKVVLPDNVIQVAPRTFSSSKLQKITIPAGVTKLGVEAFANCLYLQTVILNEGLTAIEYCCFIDCEGLYEITFPSTLTTLGYGCFMGTSLLSVVIPEGVTEIGPYAFDYCELSKVTLPNTLKTIGDNAFYGCGALQSIILPDQLVSIGAYAFGCTSFRQLIIPASVEKIGESIFHAIDHDITVFCEAASEPSGWDKRWDILALYEEDYTFGKYDCTVIWGYTGS